MNHRGIAMTESYQAILKLKEQIQTSVIGQEHVVDALILALLTNGNVLLEGLPGTAKRVRSKA